MNREDAPHLSDDRFNDLILALGTLREAIKNLNEKNEQLISGPGGIMEMKQTIADKEQRIEKLEKALNRIADLTERWNDSLDLQANEIARKALEGKDV
jgi:hypothetical protein